MYLYFVNLGMLIAEIKIIKYPEFDEEKNVTPSEF